MDDDSESNLESISESEEDDVDDDDGNNWTNNFSTLLLKLNI